METITKILIKMRPLSTDGSILILVFAALYDLTMNNFIKHVLLTLQSRRKDCLRQLLVVLCERGELQQLVQFPYIDLEDEVVSILESRARSVDLTTHNYYDLLYAFHIFRNNYRKGNLVLKVADL